MKHLKSNYASIPQGSLPLFDSVKPRCPHDGYMEPDFDGNTYEPNFDATRLRGEMARVYNIMLDQQWRTLSEINLAIQHSFYGQHDPEASISARLRDLRKARFGSHTVERRRRGDPKRGLFEYRVSRCEQSDTVKTSTKK